jgi:hypothetical protein
VCLCSGGSCRWDNGPGFLASSQVGSTNGKGRCSCCCCCSSKVTELEKPEICFRCSKNGAAYAPQQSELQPYGAPARERDGLRRKITGAMSGMTGGCMEGDCPAVKRKEREGREGHCAFQFLSTRAAPRLFLTRLWLGSGRPQNSSIGHAYVEKSHLM